jgi:hypothetical protein
MPASNVRWPVPLIRLNPWYPGQLGGVPGVSTETGLRTDTNGTVFYVDPNAVGVSDQRDGTDPNAPLETVAAALTHCGAYQNDVIVVAMNSAWMHGNTGVGRATRVSEEVTVNVPGVKLIGLAPSSSLGVPWGPVTNGGTLITVNAMDVLVEGFCFTDPLGAVGNATAIAAFWNSPPYGDNLTVRNCYFGAGLDYGVSLDFSYYTDIHDCYFDTVQVAAIHSLDVEGDPDYCRIHDNQFLSCTAAIDLEDSNGCAIYRNLIYGAAGGTNNFIDLTGGTGNIVADNWLACTIAQYDVTCSDAASGAWINNHCTNGDPAAPPV